MNKTTETELRAGSTQTTQPAPSIWTIVWPLLGSISGFTAAYFAFKGGAVAILFGLLAGVFMLLGQLTKPRVAP